MTKLVKYLYYLFKTYRTAISLMEGKKAKVLLGTIHGCLQTHKEN